jgi:hypothetical protein
MKSAVSVLFAVAKELAEQAKQGLPEVKEGESVRREWYENGRLCRETILNGESYIDLYDFEQRKSRLTAVGKFE